MDVDEVANVLGRMATTGREGPTLTPLEAAILEVLVSACGDAGDKPLSVCQITEKLNSTYDRFPTPAAVRNVHSRRIAAR